MELKQFLNLATVSEREQVATLARTTVGYLSKLASNGKCSATKGLLIQRATAEVSKKHPVLRPINGRSIVRDTKRAEYDALVEAVSKVA